MTERRLGSNLETMCFVALADCMVRLIAAFSAGKSDREI